VDLSLLLTEMLWKGRAIAFLKALIQSIPPLTRIRSLFIKLLQFQS